jgi:beta-lactamase regulating signal transducer with metallopeptidase domain
MLHHADLWVLEAALRSILMALAVWAGIRMLRVEAVLAQKIAWVLVLVSAGAMPLVMRAPFPAPGRALRIPLPALSHASQSAEPSAALIATADSTMESRIDQATQVASSSPEPAYRHRSQRTTRSIPARHRVVNAANVTPQISLQSTKIYSARPSAEPVPTPADHFPLASWSSWNWPRIRQLAAVVYLAAVCFLLIRMFAGLSIAFRIWRRAEPSTDPALATSLSATRPLHVRISPDLSTPVTIGSTVILPADYTEWDTAKLRIVLAHEQSHVRQGDFYLQLLASMHVAIFWFSPLGWWLQRKLSELAEALSDHAGLEQAASPASYAQVLLEFAAMPRTTIAGVAMARSSNLSSRIDRILNARRFRLAFLGSKANAVLAAALVPAALLAAVTLIRIVPAVEAARAFAPTQEPAQQPAKPSTATPSASAPSAEPEKATGVSTPEQVTTVDDSSDEASPAVLATPASPQIAPVAPAPRIKIWTPQGKVAVITPPASVLIAPHAPMIAGVPGVIKIAPLLPGKNVYMLAPKSPMIAAFQVPPVPPAPGRGRHMRIVVDDDDEYAIVQENADKTIRMNGNTDGDFERVRNKMHGNYIWFERDGKSYVITDPQLFAQAQQMFKGNEELEHQMAELQKKQAALDAKMAALQPEMEHAKLPGPEFQEQMAKLNAQLAELQSEKFKKLSDQVNKEFSEEKLGELQEKVGEIQERIGEIQGAIGEQQGRVGEKMGAVGEQMGELGEKMGEIGEKQGKIAEEAGRKLQSVFDQAIKDGKAKPVE